jgi:hypothetical protein
MVNYLTKSKYLSGLQCHKRLWYEKNYPGRAAAISRSQQRIFDQGREVGVLARDHFPGGMLIDATGPVESVEQTKEAIRRGISCIFEASFIFNGIWVRCDILQRDSNSWRIIEVKASTKVKEEYLPDLAVQKHVLTGRGVPISGTQLMHINRECVYPDLSNLFIIEDVTDQVDQLMGNVPNYIETFKTILDGDVEPKVLIGTQCDKPNPCPFKVYCWESVPERSIFTIPNLRKNKKTELVERGIFSLYDIPADFPLTQKQRAYVNSVLDDQSDIDNEAIKRQLSDLEDPIHFFDFETYNPAVPRFKGLGPYQQFPFQYSCHILQPDGVVTHHEYLHTDTTDPRLPLVESLLDHISNVGSVIVYSASFERTILEGLAQSFPEHSVALQSIISRLWDQMVIFRNHYKHPGFGGSKSLKDVLPVLVPSLSYQNLDIQEGEYAQAVWDLMINTTSEEEKSERIRHLKEYCEMDTRAMVEIHKALLQL